MAEEPAVLAAKRRIEQVLSVFVEHRAEAKVVVFVDELGHLRAVVATHAFEGVEQHERQQRVRDYLRKHAASEDLAHLYRVFALSAKEFDETYSRQVFGGGMAEALRLGLAGNNNGDE